MEGRDAKSSRDRGTVNNRVRPVAVTRWWDSDDESDINNVAFWERFLGAPISHWETVKLTKSNSFLLGPAVDDAAKYKKDVEEYYDKIQLLNKKLNADDKFSYVETRPRFPRPPCFYPWYKIYRMKNTNPSSLRSKRLMKPGASEYEATAMLQFTSLKFSGGFSHENHMSVYGFLAVRDGIDYLRNYIFHQTREHAHDISPDSCSMPLISPIRGIYAEYGVLVEYSIRAKNNATKYAVNDYEIIDGCFEFRNCIGTGNEKHKARIYGPYGSMDIGFVLLMHAVEATIDVRIVRAAKGYDLKTVTAFTSGYGDGIVLYDTTGCPHMSSDDNIPLLVVASAVVAVELDGELKLEFEFSNKRNWKGSVSKRELSFISKKNRCSKKAITVGGVFKFEANVNWSTFEELV